MSVPIDICDDWKKENINTMEQEDIMLDFKEIYTENYLNKKYHFFGTCVNSFDDNGDCHFPYFRDVSHFAVEEENSKVISKTEFSKLVSDSKMIPTHKDVIFLLTPNKNVVMAYDQEEDVHYFFGKK